MLFRQIARLELTNSTVTLNIGGEERTVYLEPKTIPVRLQVITNTTTSRITLVPVVQLYLEQGIQTFLLNVSNTCTSSTVVPGARYSDFSTECE